MSWCPGRLRRKSSTCLWHPTWQRSVRGYCELRVLVRERYLDCVVDSAPEEEFNAGVCRTPGVRVAVPAAPGTMSLVDTSKVDVDEQKAKAIECWNGGRPQTRACDCSGNSRRAAPQDCWWSVRFQAQPTDGIYGRCRGSVGRQNHAEDWQCVRKINTGLSSNIPRGWWARRLRVCSSVERRFWKVSAGKKRANAPELRE